MSEQPDNQAKSIRTGGGPAIEGGVDTGGGDFTGRDKITNVLGDEVHGDKVTGNKVTIGTIINNLFKGDSEDARKLRNRQVMLKLVYDIWVKGVLERSLYNQLLIDLDMEQRPEAVERPWGMVLETPTQESRLLPSGTKMIDVFTELNQSLLILGEPGSGKSTMLLELARDLLVQAEQNPALPMPVLFNLSSWAEKRHPLGQWLVVELREKYQIPKALAQEWVEQDELLLLLDGLDEVKVEHRKACVQAINDFQQNSKALVPLALCSRNAEYDALTSKLKLNGAVVLQPLTSQQITTFLVRLGGNLRIIAKLLQTDTILQELAQSPLMLSVICIGYQDRLADEIRAVNSLEIHRRYLFDQYIKSMFRPKGKVMSDLYPRDRTLYWLQWLASQMVQHSKMEFLIEQLQPDWLQIKNRIWLYRSIIVLTILFVYELCTVVLGVLFLGETYPRLINGLIIGPIVGLYIALRGIEPTERLVFSRTIDRKGLWSGLRLGLLTIPFFILYCWLEARRINELLGVTNGGLSIVLLEGILLSLLFGLFFGILRGMIRKEVVTQHFQPNQGIWYSARNMWFGGLAGGIIWGVLLGLIYRISAFLSGLLYAGIYYGGDACVQHVILRSLLTLYRHMPLNYARFLDYCADRIFLRKVGGGYIFVHRLLMEHFASLTEEDIKRLAGSSDGR